MDKRILIYTQNEYGNLYVGKGKSRGKSKVVFEFYKFDNQKSLEFSIPMERWMELVDYIDSQE